MVPLMSLWLPILVSAVLVFIVSAVIHMLLPYHRSDFARVPEEDEVRAALGKAKIPPGEYMIPYAKDNEERQSEAFIEKCKEGPVAVMTVMRPGPPAMGKSLFQWFLYSIVVGIFAAYIAGRALGPGAEYLSVFRFAGCTAFLGYSLALAQDAIWLGSSWTTTLKSMFDGLVYGLVTGGTFGWLWPGA